LIEIFKNNLLLVPSGQEQCCQKPFWDGLDQLLCMKYPHTTPTLACFYFIRRFLENIEIRMIKSLENAKYLHSLPLKEPSRMGPFFIDIHCLKTNHQCVAQLNFIQAFTGGKQ
jgi:hypothetical protein